MAATDCGDDHRVLAGLGARVDNPQGISAVGQIVGSKIGGNPRRQRAVGYIWGKACHGLHVPVEQELDSHLLVGLSGQRVTFGVAVVGDDLVETDRSWSERRDADLKAGHETRANSQTRNANGSTVRLERNAREERRVVARRQRRWGNKLIASPRAGGWHRLACCWSAGKNQHNRAHDARDTERALNTGSYATK